MIPQYCSVCGDFHEMGTSVCYANRPSTPEPPIRYKIVETDNFGGDYPNETEVKLPWMTKAQADKIAAAINSVHCNDNHSPRFWRVYPVDYKLQPGFQP